MEIPAMVPTGITAEGFDIGGHRGPPAAVRVVAWEHVDRIGFDPRSRYVETFWLPVLGPSATLLLRRLADLLEADAEGIDVDLDETAASLGLGASAGRHGPLRRALERCVRFEAARWVEEGVLGARRLLPPLAPRRLIRLPLALQEQHREWGAAEPDDGVRLRRRARLVALDLRDLGVDDVAIERHLLRRGVHPAAAFEAARWAWSPASEADRALAFDGS